MTCIHTVRIATLRSRGLCLIGLELNGVILLLIFDVYVYPSSFPVLSHLFSYGL